MGNFARLKLTFGNRRFDTVSNPIVRTALVAVFTAEALATNYLMIGLVNVKLMDALIFIAAFLFGWTIGVAVAISTWAVYGFVNPYGQDSLLLLFFLMLGESFYALGGAALRKTRIANQLLAEKKLSSDLQIALVFGVAGLALTFAYDVLTNFADWVTKTSSLYQAVLIGMVTGAPFALIHEGSNLLIFAIVSPAGILATRKITSTRGVGAR